MSDRVALYTTIYPGVEPYLAPWYRSVMSQTDRSFDLWIGLDGLTPDAVSAACGAPVDATWIRREPNDTPTAIRLRAIERMVAEYPAIVFVDSDDVLHPRRVASARAALEAHELTGCALEVIDQHGSDLGIVFGPPAAQNAASLLPRYNVFGLSNTAYRSELLGRCLPVDINCGLLDWQLATRAWAFGASLGFDRIPQMLYRQYAANIARVILPFTERHVAGATDHVLAHYRCALARSGVTSGWHRAALALEYERAGNFRDAITASPDLLTQYVAALNQLAPMYVWWWSVAHPDLENLWRN